MVTIYDIAKETGFSAPTVSKALTGQGTLSEKTRQKILETADKLGYEPNMTARTLSTKKSNLIGLVYDDTGLNRGFSHPLFSVVLNRFRERIEDVGYDIVFLSRHFKMSYSAHANYRSVDGVVIINPADQNMEPYRKLVEEKMPVVSTNSIMPGICTVLTDNEAGGYEAAEYLIRKGHRKIAFLSTPVNAISPASEERFIGFKKALEAHNVAFDENLYEKSDQWTIEGGYEAFQKLYSRTKDFTALFASTDLMALGVKQYAEENDIIIPEAFSLIGFDDEITTSFSSPHLTTFRQDAIKIADMAVQVLLEQIDGKTVPGQIRFPAMFIERDSVKDIN